MNVSVVPSTSTGHRRLAVAGRLDAVAAPALRRELDALVALPTTRLVVDLSDATFVDSAGLAALVQAMKVLRSRGGEVALVRPASADAFRVFELTRFDQVFTFVDGIE